MRLSILAVFLASLCLPGAALAQGIIIKPPVSCSDIHSAPDCSTLARGRGGTSLGGAGTVPLYRPQPVAISGSRAGTGTSGTSTSGTGSTIGALSATNGGTGILRPLVPSRGASGLGTLQPTISTPRAVGPLIEAVPGAIDGSSVGSTGAIDATSAIGTTGTARSVGPLPPVAPSSSPSPSGDELDQVLNGSSSSGGVQ
jgi:hypothetical protein